MCLDPSILDQRNTTCDVPTIGYLNDGYCDTEDNYNSFGCGWDGGDCCESTCDPDALYTCGSAGYDCQDPDVELPINWTETGCNASMDLFHYYGDGYCDELLGPFNTLACGWDGGDCCNTTCEDATYPCGISGECRIAIVVVSASDSVWLYVVAFLTMHVPAVIC